MAGWAAVVVGAVDEVGNWHFQLSTSSTKVTMLLLEQIPIGCTQ